MWEKAFSQLLKKDFERIRERNPRFSLRAYAQTLGLSHSTLSELMRGQQTWKPKPDRALEILERMKASARDRQKIVAMMGKPIDNDRQMLPPQNPKLLADWVYVPIMAAWSLPKKLRQPDALAKRFGVSIAKVKSVIEDLVGTGILMESEDGLVKNDQHWKTTDGPLNENVRKYHKNALELSARALNELTSEQRDFTALTFVGNASKLELIRKEIRALHEKISLLADAGDENDEVYRLSISFFPINFPVKKGKDEDSSL